MLVEKLPWVKHSVKHSGAKEVTLEAINSLDISPDGLRFATGGGDENVSCKRLRSFQIVRCLDCVACAICHSSQIKIWSMCQIAVASASGPMAPPEASAEPEECRAAERRLAVLKFTGSVSCVRWSHTGG